MAEATAVVHAAEVTEALRTEGPVYLDGLNIGLDHDEAICPRCSLAYFVPAGSLGVCRDCLGEVLEGVAA